ncbi:sensor histidine kinase [Paludibacterium paludis]|uniref:histidine kinase n=1 Tax=Paludibacterium paludis TaxID=1225769 RepID=A0A918UB07_9NEIS|nr:sensor histidine kinase [Paludibacterium paludis]GGY19412.1 histidine kinase [Paludibacterium paludis]
MRDSLRWRLLIATAVTVCLALTLTGWSLHRLFHDHVTRQFAQTLEAQLDQLTARLDFDERGMPIISAGQLSDPRWVRPFSGLYWQVDRVPANRPAHPGELRSRSLWDLTLTLPDDALADGQIHRHEIPGPAGQRLMALERTVHGEDTTQEGWRLTVAGDMGPTEAAIADFSGLLALSLGILFVLLMAAAMVQVHVGLAPMRDLRRALRRIEQGKARRLEGRFALEVRPLAEDFNHVLARNADLVERARTQAGNLAHAIKTPLAILRQAAEVPGESSDGTRPLADLVKEQVDLAGRQVNWHLARARAAAAAAVPGHATDTGKVIASLVHAMRLVHAEHRLTIRCDMPPDAALFAGEEQDLQEMLGNLLDNACKWARTCVTVGAMARDNTLAIVIEDDGPGIPPEAVDTAMRRGMRLDESVPGSGLGLSIAAELAELYHGGLTLDASEMGGVRATLRLPAIPPARD